RQVPGRGTLGANRRRRDRAQVRARRPMAEQREHAHVGLRRRSAFAAPASRRCALGGSGMIGASSGHRPVLLEEMLTALAVRGDGVYLDATFGGGGYSRAMLAAGAGRVLGLDRDPAAVERGRALARACPNFTMLEGRFGDLAALLGARGVDRLDGGVF